MPGLRIAIAPTDTLSFETKTSSKDSINKDGSDSPPRFETEEGSDGAGANWMEWVDSSPIDAGREIIRLPRTTVAVLAISHRSQLVRLYGECN